MFLYKGASRTLHNSEKAASVSACGVPEGAALEGTSPEVLPHTWKCLHPMAAASPRSIQRAVEDACDLPGSQNIF